MLSSNEIWCLMVMKHVVWIEDLIVTETYYISTSHSGLETNEFYLPFPKKNAPGDWYYFEGNEWMDRIHLHTIPSIISTGIGLNRMLFRAEYRGEMDDVPTYIMMDKSTGFGIWRLDLTLGEYLSKIWA
jgi:hypothetical protein